MVVLGMEVPKKALKALPRGKKEETETATEPFRWDKSVG